MLFQCLGELDHHPVADHEIGEQLAPGVVIERRTILKFAVAAATTSACSPVFGAPASAPDQLAYPQLLKEIRPLADALVKAKMPDEARYLTRIEQLIARAKAIPTVDLPGRKPYEMHTMHRQLPLVVYQIHMQPGASIKLHDHRHYNGVLMGMDGLAKCRNFDLANPEDTNNDGEFLIRQTGVTNLRPGTTSTLSRTTNNLHEVTAGPEGARLFDVFTLFSPKARSAWLEFNDRPLPDKPDTYRVRWR